MNKMSKKKIIIVTIFALIVLAGALLGWKLLANKNYNDLDGKWDSVYSGEANGNLLETKDIMKTISKDDFETTGYDSSMKINSSINLQESDDFSQTITAIIDTSGYESSMITKYKGWYEINKNILSLNYSEIIIDSSLSDKRKMDKKQIERANKNLANSKRNLLFFKSKDELYDLTYIPEDNITKLQVFEKE